jgi:hypothetical protein
VQLQASALLGRCCSGALQQARDRLLETERLLRRDGQVGLAYGENQTEAARWIVRLLSLLSSYLKTCHVQSNLILPFPFPTLPFPFRSPLLFFPAFSLFLSSRSGIKKSEDARRQRDLKKFGKKVQVAKLQERESEKKALGEKLKGLKRKRKDGEGGATGGDEDFDVKLESALSSTERPAKSARGGAAGGRGRGDKARLLLSW